ncbi:hypothetical protein Hypma_001407 [Hypsizygus marmoreus]|uniref:Uncharacterized protein n=1 Tax=Hypsizygus marmoreus TaxID=39966 RepID=A0A369K8H8_HYPMA|nr:hypothetical protein Hypma_001407 [Hypsizygus marmoreus]
MSMPPLREIFIAREMPFTGLDGSICWRWEPYMNYHNLPAKFIGPGTDVRIVANKDDIYASEFMPTLGPVLHGRLVRPVGISQDGGWADYEVDLGGSNKTKLLAIPTAATTITTAQKLSLYLWNMWFFLRRGSTPTPHPPTPHQP